MLLVALYRMYSVYGSGLLTALWKLVVSQSPTSANIFVSLWPGIEPNIYIYRASVVEWLERAVAVWEVSGSRPGKGGHKNLSGCKEPDCVSFCRAVNKQRFHTLITRYKAKNNTTTFPYKRLTCWNWISVRSHQMSLTHFLPNDQWYHLLYI